MESVEPEGMCGLATSQFEELLGMPVMRHHAINLEALGLPGMDLEALEIPFLETEIWEVIRSLPADKAPGPDGFTTRFYQSV